jgi:hypothetical protein
MPSACKIELRAKEMRMPARKRPERRVRYSIADIKALKAHSRARTPVYKIAKMMKRSVPALRAKACQMGIGLGELHR